MPRSYGNLLEQGRRRTNMDKRVESFQTALKGRPDRPEAFYCMMVHYYYIVMIDAKYEQWKLLAKHQAFAYGAAGELTFPAEPFARESTFDQEILTWRFDMEFSVVAFAAGQFVAAYRAGKRLFDGGRYPAALRDRVESNLRFFGSALCTMCIGQQQAQLQLTKMAQTPPPSASKQGSRQQPGQGLSSASASSAAAAASYTHVQALGPVGPQGIDIASASPPEPVASVASVAQPQHEEHERDD